MIIQIREKRVRCHPTGKFTNYILSKHQHLIYSGKHESYKFPLKFMEIKFDC
jgi:hypothetical protein